MYTLGIDIGSSSSKAVIMKDGKEVVSSAVIQVGTGTSGPDRVMGEVFKNIDLTPEDIRFTVATGYGRFSVEKADKQISEISCHAKGIYFLHPEARTIIDIGGQDAKAIRLDAKGNIGQFVMNDKCAAGTGRFVDVMSRVLEIPLSEMGNVHFKATEWAFVSSTCTVFAESEVISLLSQGVSRENIVAGVHQSVASKACSLVYRVGVNDDIVMCGGVAQNPGAVDAIRKQLNKPVIVAQNPQVTGALGAALFAYENVKWLPED
ncbi:MAG: acyl-CoA dehydratase activase [Lachnospiraceae bacterium]|jgi:predicted CoA-substrate-specific enzyme activase|uniref:acyl-CoA dehydratase activase n=1 Tax=Sarcina sp. DSM 11001 TaxID=1798184 RepID=UPI0008811709|nr:acyl-CoA dehydratase activase [Sarcina sp. DSM 11001]SDK92541.1 benzoyl-CoA reductase, bcr type, subunit D [Sarcina sp. DSM 11001]